MCVCVCVRVREWWIDSGGRRWPRARTPRRQNLTARPRRRCGRRKRESRSWKPEEEEEEEEERIPTPPPLLRDVYVYADVTCALDTREVFRGRPHTFLKGLRRAYGTKGTVARVYYRRKRLHALRRSIYRFSVEGRTLPAP